MYSALQCLLEGVIDYAGLFPPAKLEMRAAVDEYLGHLNSHESWIVNRFICPASRLGELASVLEANRPEASFGLSVIGTGAVDAFSDSVKRDAEAIEDFEHKFEGQFFAEAYEVKAPENLKAGARAVQQLAPLDVFLEVPWGLEMNDKLHAIAEGGTLGAKARTGGLTKDAFPDSESLAAFLQECMNLDLPFKLTAGLHHPLPHVEEQTGGSMHGFLNVLVAAALVQTHDLSRAELVQLLGERDQKAFTFREKAVVWRGNDAGIDDIEEMRSLFVGYGSCSVMEPIEGLTAMKLYKGAA